MDAVAAFKRYNLNADGMLDISELSRLLDDAAFDVDAQYVSGLADMFGTWDVDNTGGIELPEFQKMWSALGLGDALQAAASSSEVQVGAVGVDHIFVSRSEEDGYGLELDADGSVIEIWGPAKAAGVKVGWTVAAVDGQPVSGQEAILDVLRGVDGAELTLHNPALQAADAPPASSPPAVVALDEPQSPPPPPVDDPESPSPGMGAQADDEVVAVFNKYNRNGDGMLDLEEIKILLNDAHFEVDDQYVHGIAGMFGEWDTDGSGGIQLGEFRQLWDQLDLGSMLREAMDDADDGEDEPPPQIKASCFGTIKVEGALGLQLAETIDPRSKTRTVHVQQIIPGGLAARHIPGLMVGMILVTVDCNPPSAVESVVGLPYTQVLEKLSARPIALAFGLSPYNLPAALSQSMGVATFANRWKSRTRARTNSRTLTQTPTERRTLTSVAESAHIHTEQTVQQFSASDEAARGYMSTSAGESWAPVPEPEPEPEPALKMPLISDSKDQEELKKAAFDFFKGDDELLSEVELARLLDAADYAADGGYIQQVLEIFGKFDDDGSTGIDSAEFGHLWDYLQLDEKMKQSGMEDIILGESFAPQTTAALFNKYDTNKDGVLDEDELRSMLAMMGAEFAFFAVKMIPRFPSLSNVASTTGCLRTRSISLRKCSSALTKSYCCNETAPTSRARRSLFRVRTSFSSRSTGVSSSES